MRRAILCLALLLWPGITYADGWTARMEDDEGGAVMVASVEGEATAAGTPMLRMMCAGAKGLMLRYDMAGDDGSPGGSADFLFENESAQVTKTLVYEEMDGSFVVYFPPGDPLLDLLKNGSDVFVSDATGNYPAQSFPLKGSGKALATLTKSCR